MRKSKALADKMLLKSRNLDDQITDLLAQIRAAEEAIHEMEDALDRETTAVHTRMCMCHVPCMCHAPRTCMCHA